MATPDELIALAPSLPAPNDEIVLRAAKYLALGSRDGLETAHNLVTDAHNNLVTRGAEVPSLLVGYEMDLRQDRIEGYGSVGRQPDMTAPYWKRGW
jgi:hypothetical protein